MGHWFDDLAGTLATKTSRRDTLKLFAVGIGALVASPLRHTSASPAQAGTAATYPAGWNLVGGPAGSTLNGASGSLYSLQPGDTDYEAIPATSPLQGCLGYWAYFPSGGSLNAGTSQGTCLVTPTPGSWTMIGNPSAGGAAAVAGADSLLTYSPSAGYLSASAIPVGAGAWATASGSVSVAAPLPLPPPTQAPPPAAAPAPAPAPAAVTQPTSTCCRHCSTGCPCGNSCITCRDTCHQSGGCAC
jgi:hypothetical protein